MQRKKREKPTHPLQKKVSNFSSPNQYRGVGWKKRKELKRKKSQYLGVVLTWKWGDIKKAACRLDHEASIK